MRRIITTIALVVFGTMAFATPKTALVHSNYRPNDKECLNTAYGKLDWPLDKWPVEQLGKLMSAVDQYDIIVVSPVWNFRNKPGAWPEGWDCDVVARWIKSGGILIHMDAGDDGSGSRWFSRIGDGLTFKMAGCEWEADVSKTGNGSVDLGDDHTSSWCHFVKYGQNWIPLYECEHGYPLTMMAEVGKGLIITTSHPGSCVTQPEHFREYIRWIVERNGEVEREDLGIRPTPPKPPPSEAKVRIGIWKDANGEHDEKFLLVSFPKCYKFDHTEPECDGRCEKIELKAAGGEYACAQVGLIQRRPDTTAVFTAELDGIDGTVRAIDSLPFKENEWFPEVVRHQQPFSMKDGEVVKPLWITVKIPEGERARGMYGDLVVKDDVGNHISVPVSIQVYPFDLPRKQHMATDFAFRPGKAFGFFSDKAWYEQGWKEMFTHDIYLKWTRMVCEYRIIPQGYDDSGDRDSEGYETNIPFLFAEKTDDGYEFDWEKFDKQVQVLVDAGAPAIRVGYLGGATVENGGDFWKDYLPKVEAHIAEKGWDITPYIYQRDEVRKEYYDSFVGISQLVRDAAPTVKRLTVLQSKFPELLDDVTDIWVPSMGIYGSAKDIAKERREEDEMWVYVCTSSSPPNSELFIYEPGLNHRILPWIIWKEDLEGLLYYGIIFWTQQYKVRPQDVTEDGEILPTWATCNNGGQYGAGGCLLYPGGKDISKDPQPSFRLELLRQGMQDYEYLWMLENLLETRRVDPRTRTMAERLLDIPNNIVGGPGDFTKDETLVEDYKDRVANMIIKLRRCRPSAR
jgi:hypothetical protein